MCVLYANYLIFQEVASIIKLKNTVLDFGSLCRRCISPALIKKIPVLPLRQTQLHEFCDPSSFLLSHRHTPLQLS